MSKLFFIWLAILLYHTNLSRAQHFSDHTPPAPYSVTVNQPNGNTLQVVARGNAFDNWMETEDGYILVKNTEGFYEYATVEQGKRVSSGILAVNPAERSISQQRQLLGIKKGRKPASVRRIGGGILKQLSAQANARTNSFLVVPTEGEVKILTILIEYPDLRHEYEKEDFEKLLNGPSDKPTFKSYFQKNSHGKFNPTVDVVGWYQAKNNYEYYGDKHGRARARELVVEALQAALDDGVDFTQYDNTKNGNIDGVMIVHAGPGAEEGGNKLEYVWSHRSTITSLPLISSNGSLKFARDFTIQPEVRVRYDDIVGIGIFCLEFGHLLGLPDLYDTDNYDDQHYGIGEWGLMGLGGWLGKEGHPAGMSAFSKEQLGWAKVQDITEKTGKYELKPAESSGEIFKITTPNTNEYFLLENRQKSGTDLFLKGSGLAVWHIDSERTDRYPESIHVNNRRDFKGVDLEEADGKNDLDFERNRGDEGELFPGSSKRTVFNDESDPSSDLYEDQVEGLKSGVTITNIQLSNNIVSFDYGNKDEDTSGTDCENAVVAQTGDNTLPKENYWYTFTLPRDGRIVIRDANAEVYLDCDASSSLASSNDNQLTTSWLKKGETVKIELGDKQPETLPLTWQLSINSDKTAPALTVETISAKTYGDAAFDLKVSTESNGKISYERIEGPITLSGSQVNINGSGNAKVKVSVSETDEYAADEEEVSFQINKANPTINFEKVADKTYGDAPFTLEATSSIDKEVSFTVKKGSVEITDKTVKINGAGEVEIEASTQESTNYLKANKSISFRVQKANQTISFGSLENVIFEKGKEIPLSATSDSKLDVTFSIKEGEDKVALDGSVLTVQGAGSVTIEATQSGNENINPATSVSHTFEVTKATQTISFSNIPDKTVGDEAFNLEATSSIGIPVVFRLIEGNAELEGNQVILTGSGEVIVEAYNDGNENYKAVSERQSFIVAEPNKQQQTITLADLPDTVLVDEVVTLEVSVSSNLNPDIDLIGTVVRNDLALTFTQTGEVTVRISQPGNDEYNPAETVTHTFVVVKSSEVENPLGTDAQNIVYTTPNNRTFGDEPFPLEVESSSKLPVSYEIEGPVAISNGVVTILGAGEVTIRAFQTGNEEYAPSDTVELTFTVNKATQTIDLEVISIDDNTFQVQASSDADLPVIVTVSEGEGIIEGDILTVTSPSATLTATQGGNENYTAAEPVSKEVSVEVITSVSDDLEESGIVVYPNPSAGLFKVRRLTNGQQPLPYQIFDLRGALVGQGKLNSQQANIDLTNHREGTYILQLHLTDNTKQYRIVKQ